MRGCSRGITSTFVNLCCAVDWQASHSSLLVIGFPAVSMELWQPERGEGHSGEKPCSGASLCKFLPMFCLLFVSISCLLVLVTIDHLKFQVPD